MIFPDNISIRKVDERFVDEPFVEKLKATHACFYLKKFFLLQTTLLAVGCIHQMFPEEQ